MKNAGSYASPQVQWMIVYVIIAIDRNVPRMPKRNRRGQVDQTRPQGGHTMNETSFAGIRLPTACPGSSSTTSEP